MSAYARPTPPPQTGHWPLSVPTVDRSECRRTDPWPPLRSHLQRHEAGASQYWKRPGWASPWKAAQATPMSQLRTRRKLPGPVHRRALAPGVVFAATVPNHSRVTSSSLPVATPRLPISERLAWAEPEAGRPWRAALAASGDSRGSPTVGTNQSAHRRPAHRTDSARRMAAARPLGDPRTPRPPSTANRSSRPPAPKPLDLTPAPAPLSP